MTAILATGGLDEAAIAIGLAFDFCAFILAAGLIALSWWKRSLVAAIIVGVVVVGTGLLLEPWTFIAPAPVADPPYAFYYGKLRLMAVIWLFFVFLSTACLIRVIRYRRLKREARNAA